MNSEWMASRPFRHASVRAVRKGLFAYQERPSLSARDRHQPVLRKEAIAALRLRSDGVYLDATFGRGGHSAAILRELGADGRLYAIDRDPDAVGHARERFGNDPRFRVWHGNFADLGRGLHEMGCEQPLDGILLDLGVSSPQLEVAERGFSFQSDGPLDMRMDYTRGESAADWLNRATQKEIEQVLRDYGEERYARRIARRIVDQREQAPLSSTAQLAELIASAVPGRERDKHPATRSFQAIRIEVNEELKAIAAALEAALERLATGGRLVVISFHSLEDRIVKRFIRSESTPPSGGRRLPVPRAAPLRLQRVGKPVFPDVAEMESNPRARSAVMRVAERTDAG